MIRFRIGFASAIFNPNIEDETVENLGTLGVLIGSPLHVKKGIDKSHLFVKNKLTY